MFTEKKLLTMRDGTEICIKVKESGSPVWIIATHGIAEYSDRHSYLDELFGQDFNILRYDLRGHGESSGLRTYVEHFEDYCYDLKEIIQYTAQKYRMKKFILFGHSMGALVTAQFMQNFVDDELYPERVVLNAPPCGGVGLLGIGLKLTPAFLIQKLASFKHSIPVRGLVNLHSLSHDPRVKEEYVENPLNQLSIESKLILELIKASSETFTRPIRSKASNFVSIGMQDQVVNPKDLVQYFTFVEKSFQLTKFDGAYHEIHNEIEKYRKPYFDYLKKVFNETIFK